MARFSVKLYLKKAEKIATEQLEQIKNLVTVLEPFPERISNLLLCN